MPWPKRLNADGRKLLQQNRGLQSQLLRLGEQLRDNKNRCRGLELALRQRHEQIDQRHCLLDQARLKSRQSHEEAQYMAMFVA
jgi:hypothetical protein